MNKTPDNAVMRPEDGRRATRGRGVLTIPEYEVACAALRECLTLDATKYFSDLGSVKAAYARLVKDREAEHLARRVILRAIFHARQIAERDQPGGYVARGRNARGGTLVALGPGPQAAMRAVGFTKGEAVAGGRLARLSPAEREALIAQPRPPTPAFIASTARVVCEEERALLALQMVRTALRKNAANQVAKTLSGARVPTFRACAQEVSDWLDAFEQALPK